MMKWLSVYLLLLILSPVLGEENPGNSSESRIQQEDIVPAQTASEISGFHAGDDWAHDYILLMNVANAGIQFDLPGDNNNWNTPSCKILHATAKAGQNGHVCAPSASRFMRLMSARHTDGFYIYFLKKLII